MVPIRVQTTSLLNRQMNLVYLVASLWIHRYHRHHSNLRERQTYLRPSQDGPQRYQ